MHKALCIIYFAHCGVDVLQNDKMSLKDIGANIFYFFYMKRDWAEQRCYVEPSPKRRWTLFIQHIVLILIMLCESAII